MPAKPLRPMICRRAHLRSSKHATAEPIERGATDEDARGMPWSPRFHPGPHFARRLAVVTSPAGAGATHGDLERRGLRRSAVAGSLDVRDIRVSAIAAQGSRVRRRGASSRSRNGRRRSCSDARRRQRDAPSPAATLPNPITCCLDGEPGSALGRHVCSAVSASPDFEERRTSTSRRSRMQVIYRDFTGAQTIDSDGATSSPVLAGMTQHRHRSSVCSRAAGGVLSSCSSKTRVKIGRRIAAIVLADGRIA